MYTQLLTIFGGYLFHLKYTQNLIPSVSVGILALYTRFAMKSRRERDTGLKRIGVASGGQWVNVW